MISPNISFCNFFRWATSIFFQLFDRAANYELLLMRWAGFRSQWIVWKSPPSWHNQLLNTPSITINLNLHLKSTWSVPTGLISPPWMSDWSSGISSFGIFFSSPGTIPDLSWLSTFSAAWCLADFFDVPWPSPVTSPTVHLLETKSVKTRHARLSQWDQTERQSLADALDPPLLIDHIGEFCSTFDRALGA